MRKSSSTVNSPWTHIAPLQDGPSGLRIAPHYRLLQSWIASDVMDDLVFYCMSSGNWMVLRDRRVETIFFWSPDHIAECFFTATEAASRTHDAANTVVVKSEDSVPLIPNLAFRHDWELVSATSHCHNLLPSILVIYPYSVFEIAFCKSFPH
jgi:hypothetical protein